MTKKNLLIGLALLLLVGALIGYRMYNKPHQDLSAVAPDHRLSATELFADYETDEAAANQKYLDQVLRVEGTILEVSTEAEGPVSLTLDGGGLLGGVICQLDPSLTAAGFEAGQEISLQGLCTGMLMDVVLVRCQPV